MAESKIQNTATNASMKIAVLNEIITGPPAEAMLRKGGLLEKRSTGAPPVRVLDNATGVGNLVFRLLDDIRANDTGLAVDRIVGADIDEAYLDYMRKRAVEKGYDSVEVLRLDQQEPGPEAHSFTHVFNNFGVFFAPREGDVLRETLNTLESGGFAAFSSWRKLTWWDEVAAPALARYIPQAPPLPHPGAMLARTGWSDPDTSRAKLIDAGFVNVQAEIYEYTSDMDPRDFAAAGGHLIKATTARAWDSDSRAKFEPLIEQAFYDYLMATYAGGRWTGRLAALLTWGRKA